jgi:Raf kinase inhibitor-like YbhB/YbcL family protein
MDDPDAPSGTWDHWIGFNISPQITSAEEGHGPPGVSGSGTSGSRGYTGPCPPDKEHRYVFTLYALDIDLPLQEGASKSDVLAALKGHVIEQATLTGRYDRQR